jgi:pyrroline-5-carboxylate reductase
MTDRRIVLVGAGVMGEALGVGIAERMQPPPALLVVEPDAERGARVAAKVSGTYTDLGDALAEPATVVLAVKPQQMDAVLADIAAVIHPDSTVISVAAGVTTQRIEDRIPNVNVIRAMPNTPARIQAGVIGLCVGDRCSPDAAALAERVLGCVGRVVVVAESDMDAVTAISGSGPAYVFYLAEAMLAAAKDLGLSDEVARPLVVDTIAGAAALMTGSDDSPAHLRANVTSPGGTTQAAIESLDAALVAQHLRDAMRAARDRSRELS